jgi:hypothetical protein
MVVVYVYIHINLWICKYIIYSIYFVGRISLLSAVMDLFFHDSIFPSDLDSDMLKTDFMDEYSKLMKIVVL